VRRRAALVLIGAAVVLTAGCAAPETPIGMREYPADIAYADSAQPLPPPPVPAANTAPGFPGFIVPPAPRVTVDEVVVGPEPVPTPTTRTTVLRAACPEDDPLAVPDEAPLSIPVDPAIGDYPFRQRGTVKVGDETFTLPAETTHRVDEVVSLPGGSTRFNVTVESVDATTVTTYEASRRAVEGGLHIVQIRTDDQVGTDAFTPSAPIKVLPTPPVVGERWSSTGADPLHGTALTINGRVMGKTRANACGTPVDAWLVEVGADPTTGQPSRITGPGKSLEIKGTYAVATQFGGVIVAEDLVLSGTDSGDPVRIERHAVINQVPYL